MKRRMGSRNLAERRTGTRFPIQLQLRYTVLEGGRFAHRGAGYTADIGSGGVAFVLDRPLAPGNMIELSISWPAHLDGSRPLCLAIFGQILRVDGTRAVCRVERHEFRTASRGLLGVPSDNGIQLQRWAFARGLRPATAE